MDCSTQASLSFTISWCLLKLTSIESVMPSNHLFFCHPFLLLPWIFPSIRVFSNELAFCIRWPKYWSFSFSISPSNEYSVLISFRIDWFDLLVVQGTLKSLSNATVQKHQFLGTHPFLWSNSHRYMTTGKTIALTKWTFVGKVIKKYCIAKNCWPQFYNVGLPQTFNLLKKKKKEKEKAINDNIVKQGMPIYSLWCTVHLSDLLIL